MPVPENLSSKSIHEIARIIRSDWSNVYFGAEPYLKAMFSLDEISDNYYEDSGKSIVTYFLANAGSWRGEVARAVKAELNRRIK